MKSEPGILLTDVIVTPIELGKIQRELFAIDDFLVQAKNKSAHATMPTPGSLLQSLISSSKLEMLKSDERTQLVNQLKYVRRTAPVVHITFASTPSKRALRALVKWFRSNIHPNTLIEPGVQASIGGGCLIRTSTKTFDFSIQKILADSKPNLARSLQA